MNLTASQRATLDMARLKTAIDHFCIDVGRFPTQAEGLDALLKRPDKVKNWNGPYLNAAPTDPWGHPYVYQFPSKLQAELFDLSCAGPDGVAGTADDIGAP
jgi:general secretion pathway protein G